MGYTHGIKWSNELIEKKIKEVMKALCIDHMPSVKEMELVIGDFSLSNKIAKTGGSYKWARKLGLNIKESETKLGKKYEGYSVGIISQKGYKTKRMSVKHPYDLLVEDNIKVDVKVSKPYSNENGTYHTFNLEKRSPTCDIYMCFLLDDDESIDRLIIIPSKYVKLTQLSIGKNSKYNVYCDRWDYIEKYKTFYKEL